MTNKEVPAEAIERSNYSAHKQIDFRFGQSEDFFHLKWGLNKAQKLDALFKGLSKMEKETVGDIFGARFANGVGEGRGYPLDGNDVKPNTEDSKDHKELLRMLKASRGDCTLWRIRLTAKQRLWGILEGEKFYICLWDIDHRIYPTEPQNT